MEMSRKRARKWEGAGLLALAVAACAGCCAPLVAPLLGALFAWSGAAGLAAGEQYALAGLLFGASALALAMVLRRRRAKAACGCTR